MRLKKRRLPADYCRFDSELFYAFVISSSEATNRSGKTGEAGDWRASFRCS